MRNRTTLAGIALLLIGTAIEMLIKPHAPGLAVVAAGAILVALRLSRSKSKA